MKNNEDQSLIKIPEFNTQEKITIKCNKCHETFNYNTTYSQADDLFGNHYCSSSTDPIFDSNDDIPF